MLKKIKIIRDVLFSTLSKRNISGIFISVAIKNIRIDNVQIIQVEHRPKILNKRSSSPPREKLEDQTRPEVKSFTLAPRICTPTSHQKYQLLNGG